MLALRKWLKLQELGGLEVDAVVVDLGCGEQPFRELLPMSTRYVGIDVLTGFKMSHKRHEMVFFDGENVPIKSSSVDMILATEVFEHVEHLSQILREIARVLLKTVLNRLLKNQLIQAIV